MPDDNETTLAIDGAPLAGPVTEAQIRRALSEAEEMLEARAHGRVMQAVPVPNGVVLWVQDSKDRRVGHESSSPMPVDEAVGAVLSFVSGAANAQPTSSAQPRLRPAVHPSSSSAGYVHAFFFPLLALAAFATAVIVGVRLYDSAGTGDPPYVVLPFGAIAFFAFIFFYMRHTFTWFRRALERMFDLEIRRATGNNAAMWQVADDGRYAAKFVVGSVALLLALSTLLIPATLTVVILALGN